MGIFIQESPYGDLNYGVFRLHHVNGNPISFADPFGLKPGDPFSRPEAAAKDVLKYINPRSIRDNREYGGEIYFDPKAKKYYATKPIKGGDQGVNPHASACPASTSLVGDYHTHGDYSTANPLTGAAVRTANPALDQFNSDNFSSTDINGISSDASGHPFYKGYLGTPSNNLKQFDPATGLVTPLR